ncbi:hypothetical protein Slin15195_G093190 [Septoria linicola]|uniref:Uncharacterized protein n=1 Tax=Septoria linicola TaxID=215465 RepID=A0A9Q9AVN9_9PEZI|nr:hypothetical protein Slin14017_G056300 [Septoria linicola]USW56000.1 hypothetical protein Slin15195_G093190 [Septoria linicola]
MWQRQCVVFSLVLTLAAALPGGSPPAPQSLCDKYTTALLMDNTAENQQTVLTLVVNTAIIGNYTSSPGSLVKVDGILAPGTGDFEGVDLSVYFSGALPSTNTGRGYGEMVNFLDGGGADPLKMNMPAADTNSCSLFGNTISPYEGRTSQYEVHKYMALDEREVGWFITQVGTSAASFGVTDEDVATVGQALQDTFGRRCSAPASVPPTAEPELQAICIESSCPLADMPMCEAYEEVVEPY